MEKSEEKIVSGIPTGNSSGIKLLARLAIASGIVAALYLEVGKLIAERGMAYRVWVRAAGYINMIMVLPLLLLLLAWAALNRGRKSAGWERRLLAVGMAVLYLFWLFVAMFFFLLGFHEERRLVGDLLLSNEAEFLGENVWVYYRQKGLFFRVPGKLEDADRLRYLEEKYGCAFAALEEKDGFGNTLFGEESHPDISVKVAREGWELKDNYMQGLTVYYLEEGYQELGLTRPAEIKYTGPYFYLELEDEADIGAFSEDASRLMQYAASRTQLYEEYMGVLYFIHMEGKEEVTGSISFGHLSTYSAQEKDYWKKPESVAEHVAKRYEEGMEYISWRQEYEESLEASRNEGGANVSGKVDIQEGGADASGKTDIQDEGGADASEKLNIQGEAERQIHEEELVDSREEAARRIYEEVLEEQGYSYEVCYNAKGNLYIDLGLRPAGQEGDSETEGFYWITLVYDRVSKNGACELFVLYKEHQRETETGTVYGNTAIVNFYAVETENQRVIAADKTAWAEVGCAEYREATGE